MSNLLAAPTRTSSTNLERSASGATAPSFLESPLLLTPSLAMSRQPFIFPPPSPTDLVPPPSSPASSPAGPSPVEDLPREIIAALTSFNLHLGFLFHHAPFDQLPDQLQRILEVRPPLSFCRLSVLD